MLPHAVMLQTGTPVPTGADCTAEFARTQPSTPAICDCNIFTCFFFLLHLCKQVPPDLQNLPEHSLPRKPCAVFNLYLLLVHAACVQAVAA
jgi:hypothetical protein